MKPSTSLLGCALSTILLATGCGSSGVDEPGAPERQPLATGADLGWGGSATAGPVGSTPGATTSAPGTTSSSADTEGEGGATSGGASGAGGADGAGGAAVPGDDGAGAAGAGFAFPQPIQIACGNTLTLNENHDRKLAAVRRSGTEAGAKALCQAAPWEPTPRKYICATRTSCPDTPRFARCTMYVGPDAFETEACKCVEAGRQWVCTKTGEMPVGSALECLSCYHGHLTVPCGEKVKMPDTLVATAWAVGRSEVSEQDAKQKCEAAEWYSQDVLCDAAAPSRAKLTVTNPTECFCGQYLRSPAEWECVRSASIEPGSDLDCTHCKHPL